MQIAVVELRRVIGSEPEMIRREEFKSWKSAYRYLENDLLCDRECPNTNITKWTKDYAVIQHWGDRYDDETCKCNDIREAKWDALIAEWKADDERFAIEQEAN